MPNSGWAKNVVIPSCQMGTRPPKFLVDSEEKRSMVVCGRSCGTAKTRQATAMARSARLTSPSLWKVATMNRKAGIDEMIFVVDRQRLDSYEDICLLCEELGVTARVVLNLFPHSIARMELHELDGFPLLTFSTTPTDESLLFVRRVMDVVLSVLLTLIFLPVAAVSAVAIKLSSPGPILFSQRRSGLHGRPFTMYKFRSMTDDAESRRSELESINEMDGPVFKSSRDPRVTVIGKILRRFSIDELPQLYNVFKGDMSLVGPRPPLPSEVAHYERWQRRRLSMKPGITCLWQISGRNQLGFDEWMRLDLSYIDNWSLLLDLKILLKTVPVVLLGKGAR